MPVVSWVLTCLGLCMKRDLVSSWIDHVGLRLCLTLLLGLKCLLCNSLVVWAPYFDLVVLFWLLWLFVHGLKLMLEFVCRYVVDFLGWFVYY